MDHDGDHVEPVDGDCSGGYQISSASSTNLVQTVNTGECQNFPGTQSFESTNPEPNAQSNESQFISASNNGMNGSDSITPTQTPQASVLEPTEHLSVSPLPPKADADNNVNELAFMTSSCMVVGQLKGIYSNNPNIGNQIVCDFVIGRFTGTFKPYSSVSYGVEASSCKYSSICEATFVGAFYGAISRDNENMCCFEGAFIGKWQGKFVKMVDITGQALSNGEVDLDSQFGVAICPAHISLQLWLAQIDDTDKSQMNSWAKALSQMLKSYGKQSIESNLTVPFTFVYANIMYQNRMPYSKEYTKWEQHVRDTVEHLPSSAQPYNIQQDTRVFVGNLIGLLKGTCALNDEPRTDSRYSGQFTGTFLVECTGKFDEESMSPSTQTPTTTFTGYIYEAKFEGHLLGNIQPLGDLLSIDRLSESGDYIGGEFQGNVTGKFVEYESTGGVLLNDDQKLCLQWYHFIKHDRSRRDALPNEPTSSADQLQHSDPSGHFASTEALTEASNQVSTDETANGEPELHESEQTEAQSPHLPPHVTLEPHSNGDSLNVCSTVATMSNESQDKSTTTTSDHSFVNERTEDVLDHEGHQCSPHVEPNGGIGDDDDALSSASANNLLQTPNSDELLNLSCPQSFDSTSHESNVPSNESQHISSSNGMSSIDHITPTTVQANQLEPIDRIPSIPFASNESRLTESQLPVTLTEPHSNGDSLKACSTVSNELQDKSKATASTSGQQSTLFKSTAESCVKQIVPLQEMSNHFTTEHGKRKRFRKEVKCTAECCKGHRASSQGMSQPLTRAHGKRKRIGPPFECTVEGCVQHFDTFEDFCCHLSEHGKEKTKRTKVECTVEGCGQRFDTYQDLSRHLTSAHGNRKPQQNDLRCFARGCTQPSTCGSDHAYPTAYVCPISSCGAEFVSQKVILKHIDGHYKVSDFKCSHCLCYHRTMNYSLALRHWNNMNRENDFDCGTGWCTYTFESQASLDAHVKAIHPHNCDKLFKCTFKNCSLESYNGKVMYQHEQDVHMVHMVHFGRN